jgi:tRNA(adenine34) deaminase
MCAGAIVNARIDEVVFGAYDPKAGACGSLYNLAEGRLNHTPRVTGGVLADEAAAMLKAYFRNKRAAGKGGTVSQP